MTKSGLIEKVAERTPHISKKDTEIVVNTIFDAMTEALKLGERIEIRGFGSFQVKVREAREGRNPKTGEPVHISAKRTPFFKVGKELKEMVDAVEQKISLSIRVLSDREQRETLRRMAQQQAASQTTTLGDLIAGKLAQKSEGGD